MTEAKVRLTVNEIVEKLRKDAGGIDLDSLEMRMFIRTLRQLAKGAPIADKDVARIAVELGMTFEDADAVLNWLAERNDEGSIVGLAGLSLNDWSHTFVVAGRDLSTWCGLDTLYLPPLLKQTAEVESTDPVTGEKIRLTIGPDRVESYAPSSAVISIVVPKIKKKGIQSAEQIWTAFCNYSLYFSSRASAEEWFQGKSVEPVFLSIDEGFQVGREWLSDDVLAKAA